VSLLVSLARQKQPVLDMTLSYLVSTAGHAQEQNERNPHAITSILQLIKEGAEEFRDEKVVGFAQLDQDETWVCDRYCAWSIHVESWGLIGSVRRVMRAVRGESGRLDGAGC
jgi:hypothetical protein